MADTPVWKISLPLVGSVKPCYNRGVGQMSAKEKWPMVAQTIDIHEAQGRLSELLAFVMAGNEVVVTQAQEPVMRLVPVERGERKRIAGLHAGMGWISDDFDAPLPDDFGAGAA